jgi:pimeloyl-ACP methyl ester carboxylesterase
MPTKQSEAERLSAYYPFDEDVLERVSQAADEQRSESWDTMSKKVPKARIFDPRFGSKPVGVLDIIPKDHDGVQVYHLPMGNGLDENMTARIATLAATEPTKRIIAFGNPGAPGINTGKIEHHRNRKEVKKGDLRAAIDPALQYLAEREIDTATHIGFSYGADRAAASAQYANLYDQQVPQSILMEPASVQNRELFGLKSLGVLKLAADFGSTAKALDGYVKAAGSDAYLEARKLAEKRGHGLLGYTLGLARLSNIAIAQALAKDGFEGRVDAGLESQAQMRADILWGTDSELALNDLMVGITDRLIKKYGANRVGATALEDQKHAMGDDIFLHTAMVLQALKNNK